ncbi:predicted protein [Uncinocarpus reesii 1704]|uniref:Uncharacterized protein n=1 Tax=Uncinocarpus reesii (strain UAMH 1704) TaxID=336963 RepID=C4JN18_UNCRE|nr:uncharacterized protein UREG_04226 [Uncinocarpus reesii 1704]EEP79380.1 predicted protein [Uncinocarpus reesii 1704]
MPDVPRWLFSRGTPEDAFQTLFHISHSIILNERRKKDNAKKARGKKSYTGLPTGNDNSDKDIKRAEDEYGTGEPEASANADANNEHWLPSLPSSPLSSPPTPSCNGGSLPLSDRNIYTFLLDNEPSVCGPTDLVSDRGTIPISVDLLSFDKWVEYLKQDFPGHDPEAYEIVFDSHIRGQQVVIRNSRQWKAALREVMATRNSNHFQFMIRFHPA